MDRVILVLLVSSLAVSCARFHPLPLKPEGMHMPAGDVASLKLDLKEYSDDYLETSGRFRMYEYRAGDIAFAGALIGLAGGLAESIGVVVAGTAIGGAPSLFSTRYKYQSQAVNYEKASKAMRCLYAKLLFESKEDPEFVQFVNLKIEEVQSKLVELQGSIVLTAPDTDQLSTAIENAIKTDEQIETQKDIVHLAKQELSQQKQKLRKETHANPDFTTTEAGAAQEAVIAEATLALSTATAKLNQLAQEKVRNELDKCVAAFL